MKAMSLETYLATPIPPDTNRNHSLFVAILQARERGWAEDRIVNEVCAKAAMDGLPPVQINSTFKSAMRRTVTPRQWNENCGNGRALDWDSIICDGAAPTAKTKATSAKRVEVVEPVDIPYPDVGADVELDAGNYLAHLFRTEDYVSIVSDYTTEKKKDGTIKFNPVGKGEWRTAEEWINEFNDRPAGDVLKANADVGVWVRLNPIDPDAVLKSIEAGDSKGVTDAHIVEYRYCLVESDAVDIGMQYGILRASGLPIVCIVHSGGKSLHAVVKVDAGTDRALYDARRDLVYAHLERLGFQPDPANKNPSRLSRLPGIKRRDSWQFVVEWNSGPATFEEWAAAQAQWPDPQPLPTVASVEPFALDMLPEAFRDWIADIAERIQVPPDYPAAAAVVALSAVIGRQVGIRPKCRDNWCEVPNLWGCIVGKPGTLKSPALKEALAPLLRIGNEAFEEYQEAKRRNREKEIIIGAEKKSLKSKIEKAIAGTKGKSKEAMASADDMARQLAQLEEQEEARPCRRYYTNDATVEKLIELHEQNPNGLLAFRDELSGFLSNLEKDGREGDRSLFIQGWNGNGEHIEDRIGRGTHRVRGLCLSVFGSIQPEPLAEYLRKNSAGAGADGFIPRFQVAVIPDIPKAWQCVDHWPNKEAKARAFEVFQRCANLDLGLLGAEYPDDADGLPFLRFDAAAQPRFFTWWEGLEGRIRSGELTPAMADHLGKYRGLVPKLAIIFHIADGHCGPVGVEALEKAIWWATYLESHARRIYGAGGETEAARLLLVKVKARKSPNPFTAREVQQKGWAGIPNTAEGLGRVLAVLETHGHVRSEEKRDTGGRPSTVWHVHPAYLEAAKVT